MRARALRILVALDIFIFSLITLGASKRNETVSSAAWQLELDGRILGRIFRPLIDTFARLLDDHDHCAGAWLYEQQFNRPDFLTTESTE